MLDNLMRIRKLKSLNQKSLAEKLGVGQSTVSMWESGKSKPRSDMLLKLAQILGCTVDELLRDGDKEVG